MKRTAMSQAIPEMPVLLMLSDPPPPPVSRTTRPSPVRPISAPSRPTPPAPVTPPVVTATPPAPTRPPRKQRAKRRELPVARELLWEHQRVRAQAMTQALTTHPQSALLHLLVGMIQGHGCPARAANTSPAGLKYAAHMATYAPNIFTSPAPGELHSPLSGDQLLAALMRWPQDALLRLLAFYTAATAYVPTEPTMPATPYHQALYSLTGEPDPCVEIDRAVLSRYRTSGLRELIRNMDEVLRPIVLEDTTKEEMIELILERLPRLLARGWTLPTTSLRPHLETPHA